MDDIFVARIMTTDLHTVRPGTLVEGAADVILSNDIGSVIVVNEQNGLEGILTSTDFVEIVREQKPKDQTPVSAYMSTEMVTVSAQDSVEDAASVMLEHGVHHLPVVDDTEGVIGIVTTTDLTAYVSNVRSTKAPRA
ncbi:MAG: CBS domain-containing protein [Natronomonas sp.]|jgi:CBS domain-containing protein|uniref:CBS domain-containing protein n=1 Tax=Natronomonas sp. TaxID=2184060 RepID=UPI0039E710B3